MTTEQIVNAAPMSIMLGINDKSARQLPIEAEALPTHLVKIPFFAKWGPTNSQLVGGNGLQKMYHKDTVDLRKKYANHSTVLLNNVIGTGSLVMAQRMVPEDAPKPASLRLYADVLPFTKPLYQKNTDGSIKLDNANKPIPTGQTAPGFKVKFVVEEVPMGEDGDEFGLGTLKAGDQTDEVTSTQSQRYPIKDLDTPFQGEHGKNMGLRLWAPTLRSGNPVDDRMITDEMAYPYRMACVTRDNVNATGELVNTIDGERFVDVCLKPGAVNHAVGKEMYVGDTFIESYQNLADPVLPPTWGPFGRLHVYQDNIDTLLEMFYEAEVDHLDEFSDLKGEEGEMYRFNIFGGQSSSGSPYNTYEIVTGVSNSVRLADSSTIYALGGGDGTMNDEKFAELVGKMARRYNDPSDEFTDMALYPESVIYDSGYPLDTKYDLLNFIGHRKDTAVILATYTAGARKLTASEESSLAIALRTRAKNFPESEFFGTEVVRCAIFGRHGRLLNSQWRGQLPLVHEFATKAAAYMGAGNGIWKSEKNFESGDAANVSMFTDINVTFTPSNVRNKDWDNGLNWVEAKERRVPYFPALKTVYGDDTSVLTSIFTMFICVEVQKVADRVRKQFSGVTKLTEGQLIKAINDRITELTNGRFDDRVTVVPKAYVTKADQIRGFSWTCPIQVYAANMKTVGTIFVESYRNEDLVQ